MVDFGAAENLLVAGDLVIAPGGEEVRFVVLDGRQIGTEVKGMRGGLTVVIYRSPRIKLTASPNIAPETVNGAPTPYKQLSVTALPAHRGRITHRFPPTDPF